MTDTLFFAEDIKKPECLEMLSFHNIPFDPKAKVAELRDLLIANELALAPEFELDEMVSIIGEKFHNCEMAGEEIKFVPGDELELIQWKADALVNFGVARYK